VKYPFEKHVLVCNGPRCNDLKHGEERGDCIRAELKDLNKSLGRKPTVRVCGVTCLDLCDHGPNMIIDGVVYSHLNRETAKAAYRGAMGDDVLRRELELDVDEFRAGGSAAKK
jgi:NADH:ubiquinone oxidoreductase subunit E